MKIVVISQYFLPDITAASFRIGEFAKYILKQNIDLKVITTMPHKINIGGKYDIIPEDNICRINLKSNKRIFQYIEFAWKARKVINKLDGIDWIFISSPPLTIFQIVKSLTKKNKIFLDIRDIWPDTPVAAGKMKKGIIYFLLKRYEYLMYQKSTLISVVSQPMSEYIKKNCGKEPIVVYNGISQNELNFFIKKSPQSIKQVSSDKFAFNICYFGNIGLLQGLSIVPQAIYINKKSNNIKFEIIGDGVYKKNLINLVNTYKINKYVNFYDPIPREKLLLTVFRNADILFLNLKKDPILEKTIPSKLFDYLLLQKPIISGIEGEGKEILKETDAAVFFKQDSPVSLVEAIEDVTTNYNKYKLNASINMLNIAKRFVREKMFKEIVKKMREI